MNAHGEFVHLDPGPLRDGDLCLELVESGAADPVRGWVPWYGFALQLRSHGAPVGALSLRVGHTEHIRLYAGHVGYNVVPEWRGRRYAARATRLIFPLAHEHGLNPLWITCNPDNAASIRTLELLGATLVETVDLPEDTDMYREGERRKHRFRIDL